MKNEEFAHEMGPAVHRIRDAMARVIGAQAIADVATVDGKEKLKGLLIDAINAELHEEQVERIYFVSFVTDSQ